MAQGDLTILANVKAWLQGAGSSTANDALYTRLIHSSSGYIQRWLGRNIALQSYTERRNGSIAGQGRYRMLFANYPVYSVASVTQNGTPVALSPDGGVLQQGYAFDDISIWMSQAGCGFAPGMRNILLSYMAGFTVVEYGTVPVTPFQIVTSFLWLSDVLVTIDGVTAVKVAASPVTGQYAVSAGTYTFAVADVGKAVVITYSFVPPEIEQVCIDFVGLYFTGKDRIGVNSKAIAGETISFVQKDMTSNMKTALQQFKKVIPIV